MRMKLRFASYYRGAVTLAGLSLVSALLQFAVLGTTRFGGSPGIALAAFILCIALASLAQFAGFVGLAWAFSLGRNSRAISFVFWLWAAIAVPVQLYGLMVAIAVR